MKLSQIKNLSWTIALCSAGFGGFFTYKTFSEKPAPVMLKKWEPAPPEATDFAKAERMSEHKLMKALAFLTKVDPPPKPIEIKPVAPTPVIKAEPPKPQALKLPIELALIAYNDKNPKKSMAFIRATRKQAHPYYAGEKLLDIPNVAHVDIIQRDHVIVKAPDGRTQKLILKKTAVKAIAKMPVRTAVLRSPPPQTVVKPEPDKGATLSKKNVHRIVPKTRNVTKENDYNIHIIEYDSGNDDKRYAITDADKRKLESQKFRLMSEVNINPAYDKNGDAIGLDVAFMIDNPLLKKFGFKDGDIVTHVNDQAVKTVDDGHKIHSQLTNKDRRVKIQKQDKNGRKMIVFFEMDDFPNVPPK